MALNRYMYVKGNPIRYNDPSGHCMVLYSDFGVSCYDENSQNFVKRKQEIWANDKELDLANSIMQKNTDKIYESMDAFEIDNNGDYYGLSFGYTAFFFAYSILGGYREDTDEEEVEFDGANFAMDVLGGFSDIAIDGAAGFDENIVSPLIHNKPILPFFQYKGYTVGPADDIEMFGDDWGGHSGQVYITDWFGYQKIKRQTSNTGINDVLGLEYPNDVQLQVVEIPWIMLYKQRFPMGGNKYYMPGGTTSGGVSERIISPINISGFKKYNIP